MQIVRAILNAKRIGVRNFRDGASRFIKKHKPIIITEHGSPESVLLPYNDVMEIVDILDELQDKEALKAVAEGRKAIAKGAKGISASNTLK